MIDTTASASPTLAPEVLASPEWQRRIDELAATFDIPGAQVGVVCLRGEDADIRVMSTGAASRRHGAPVTDRTVFHYGSISKVWTTTLILQLVDEGRISLDTTIAEVLPEVRLDREDAAGAVTVRQLLTHTSGIEGDFFRFTGENDDALTAYLAQLPESRSITAPGGPLSYCNTGFSIAGAMTAALRETLWDDLVTTRIGDSLGVSDLLTRTADAGLFPTAVGHVPLPNGAPAAPVPMWQLPRSLGPAGLIVGNADALLRFAAAHLRDGLALTGKRILSAPAARAMRELEVSAADVSTVWRGWGLGWMLADWGTPVAWHSGSTIGQTSSLVTFPELGVALCVLTNSAAGTAFIAAVEKLIGEELGLTRPVPREDPDADQEAVRALVGQWRTPWVLAEITETASAVMVSVREKPAVDSGAAPAEFPLRAAGGNRFLFDRLGMPTEVARIDHDGREYLWAGRLLERVPASGSASTDTVKESA